MLRRKPKRRYLLIWHATIKDTEAVEILRRRCAELFGHVTVEKAFLRQMRSFGDRILLSVNLSELHPVLVSISLCHPPMVVLDMSGSLRQLEQRIHQSENPSTEMSSEPSLGVKI